MLSNTCAKFEPFLLFKICWLLMSKFWKSKGDEDLPHASIMTMMLEMTCVFALHYCLKMYFSSINCLFRRFIGQKVYFQTIVQGKNTCHLKCANHNTGNSKSPFDLQNFDMSSQHFLNNKNGSNFAYILLNTI